MKIGIVVPFSWSFWGAVVEHAELQAHALMERGHDVRLIMANDPPGQFTRVLHPRVGRHGDPPPHVIPVGRSVIVPANGSLPNIALSPRTVFRIRRTLARERFDVLHLHEPMTPAICVAVLVAGDRADRGDAPRLRRPRLDEARDARLGIPDGPGRPADRRLRASARVGRPLARRPVGDRAQRGARAAPRATPGTASTPSSSPAATSRARGCRCCCAPGPRSGVGRGPG